MLIQQQTRTSAVPILAFFVFSMLLNACSSQQPGQNEILLGLNNSAVPLLMDPKHPDPLRTGISSLDALNRKWEVQKMEPVFADVSTDDPIAVRNGLAGVYKLTVPNGTNLKEMIEDYRADPNITYAELNKPADIQ